MKPVLRILKEGEFYWWHLMQPAPSERSFTTPIMQVRGNPICRAIRQGIEYWEALTPEDRAAARARTAARVNR